MAEMRAWRDGVLDDGGGGGVGCVGGSGGSGLGSDEVTRFEVGDEERLGFG